MANITFKNNTDYREGISFKNKKSFIRFADNYISHPSRWGNLYWQEIGGIQIKWSIRKGGWVEGTEKEEEI